jgi:hypothetical protein
MRRGKHIFPKNGRKIFFAEGLDRNLPPSPDEVEQVFGATSDMQEIVALRWGRGVDDSIFRQP